ncbi:hypothetical protein AAE478_010057 [Parahypoxylon ruwenzoriense]
MVKPRPSVPMGSLDSMASRIRDQKAARSNQPLSRSNQKFAKESNTSSSSNDSDSSDDSDGSDSGSDVDIDAARKKFNAQQASKRQASKAKAKPIESSQNAKPPPPIATHARKSIIVKAEESGSDSDSDSESASESSDSGNEAPPNTNTKEVAQSKSESDGEDSGESEGENEGASVQQPVAEAETSSEEDSESEDEEVDAKAPAQAKSSHDDGSESDSSDVSEEESDHGEAHNGKLNGNAAALSKVNGTTTAGNSTTQVSRPLWLNNSDFTLRKASSDNPAREVTEFFSKANLEDKQVWYFTAPASLPITVLKDMEIDLSKATTGGALLSHKGDDYGLDLESYATNTQIQLLIPSRGGDNYTALNRGIDSTVHLRRMAKFGPGGAVSATATDDYAPIPKAIREQPQGLRPRFTPIGVPNPAPSQIQLLKPRAAPAAQATSSESESESESSSDEEMANVSNLATPSIPPKKSKSDAVNGKLKRKHPGDEEKSASTKEPQSHEKSAKRPKTASAKKPTPVQPPVLSRVASPPNGTPSKAPGSSSKGKTKKDKPKLLMKPTKQTPIPPPTLPGMKR